MEGVEKMSTLDILLGADLPDMRKNLPEQKVEVPRLSQEAGEAGDLYPAGSAL